MSTPKYELTIFWILIFSRIQKQNLICLTMQNMNFLYKRRVIAYFKKSSFKVFQGWTSRLQMIHFKKYRMDRIRRLTNWLVYYIAQILNPNDIWFFYSFQLYYQNSLIMFKKTQYIWYFRSEILQIKMGATRIQKYKDSSWFVYGGLKFISIFLI